VTLFEDAGLDDSFTVSSLGDAVSRSLRAALPGEVWVRGEIRDLTRAKSGHVYFRLVEAGDGDRPGGTVTASLSVMLSARNKATVNRTLKDAGAGRLDAGTQVKIRGRVDWYAPRGQIQLLMTGVDPIYTLGQLAAERAAVVRRLQADGVFDANRRLSMPVLPIRIGLVTSLGSDAERDVLAELTNSGIGFSVWCFDARVQGDQAPATIATGVAVLDGTVDVIVLARGGGGATDLQAFDSDRVARAICAAGVPVLTGIGHERDVSVADEVAHGSHKTPTAVARHLIELVSLAHERAHSSWDGIAQRAGLAIEAQTSHVQRLATATATASAAATERQRHRLERIADRVGSTAPHCLSAADDRLDRAQQRLGVGVQRGLRDAERRLGALDAQLRLVDPSNLLARGWSITRRADGTVVRTIGDVGTGDAIETTLHDGQITSTVG